MAGTRRHGSRAAPARTRRLVGVAVNARPTRRRCVARVLALRATTIFFILQLVLVQQLFDDKCDKLSFYFCGAFKYYFHVAAIASTAVVSWFASHFASGEARVRIPLDPLGSLGSLGSFGSTW